MGVSIDGGGSFLRGALVIRALLFWLYITAPDFLETPIYEPWSELLFMGIV